MPLTAPTALGFADRCSVEGIEVGCRSPAAALPARLSQHLLEQLGRQGQASQGPALIGPKEASLAAVGDEPRFGPCIGHTLPGLPAQDRLGTYAKLRRPAHLGYAERFAQRPQYRVPGRALRTGLGQRGAVTRSHAEHLAVSYRALARVYEGPWVSVAAARSSGGPHRTPPWRALGPG